MILAALRQLEALVDDSGQNLVEYALVALMIVSGATAGMASVAVAITHVFTHLATLITGRFG